MLGETNNLADLRIPLEGQLLGSHKGMFSRIITDSRLLRKGDLFLALKGDKHDGHDFISQADAQGAAAYIVNRDIDTEKPRLIVRSTDYALGRLAALHRLAWSGTLVAITGSNGKTTTKEMIGALLSHHDKTLITYSNENNHLGVPMTLLKLDSSHRYAVIEIGADKPDEISYSTQLAKPHIAVLGNVNPSHLSGFGTVEEVAKEKGELIKHSIVNGTAILGKDCCYYEMWQKMAKDRKVISFARQQQDADVRISDFHQHADGIHFQLDLKGEQGEFYIPLLGEHNALNAAAACAVGQELGMKIDEMADILSQFKPVNGRMDYQQLGHQCLLIDDSYNANPASTRQALETLHSLPWQGKKLAILADMLELGAEEKTEHKAIGDLIDNLNIDGLMTFGNLASLMRKGSTKDAWHQSFHDKDKLLHHLAKQDFNQVAFLVKGSRGMQMEEVVKFLTNQLGKR